MKIPVPAYRCALGPLQPDPPDPEAVKREGWQSHQIFVVSEHNRRLGADERAFVRRLGERLYGGRENRDD